MGFDASQLTQDKKQDLFTIKTRYPIPLALYTDRYTWTKYGRHILLSTILLNRIENLQTHSLYCNALQQLLRTDLDGIFFYIFESSNKSKTQRIFINLLQGKVQIYHTGRYL
jgi:hypothetical protein